MSRQRNWVFIYILKDRTPPSSQRQSLAKSLPVIFDLHIPSSFPFIKPYNKVGVANGYMLNWVVVEGLTIEARNVTLSNTGLLACSMRLIDILPDSPTPRKSQELRWN